LQAYQFGPGKKDVINYVEEYAGSTSTLDELRGLQFGHATNFKDNLNGTNVTVPGGIPDSTCVYFDTRLGSLGLKACKDIEANEYLFAYAGEVINKTEKELRVKNGTFQNLLPCV